MAYRTGFGTKPISAPSLASRGPPRYADCMAIYHLTHRTVGRSTHAAGTAGAHVGYITRATACRAVIAWHIPEAAPGSKGGAARAWLDAQELADRKNARVIDKLEIALPLELDQTRRIEAVRAFVHELAEGRAVPFFAAFHDKPGTKDEANPHAHVVIRDRDPATGKGRVIGMSEKGSTERAREVWERICNEALEAAGKAARIDRRSLKAQGIDRTPQGHEGPQARQIEAKGRTSDKLARIRNSRTEARKRAQEAAEAQTAHLAAREKEQAALAARRAAAMAEEARRWQEIREQTRKAAETRQRAAAAQAEARERELVGMSAEGRALIEQDRRRVILVVQHDISRLGPEWAALETPPRAEDLATAGQWVQRGNGKRLDENHALPPKPLWVDDFKETLIRAWQWVARLIERNDPKADRAAGEWASFHKQGPEVMAEWRALVERDAQAILKANPPASEPEPPSPVSRPRSRGPSPF